MFPRLKVLFLALVLSLTAPLNALAQTQAEGAIAGIVIDAGTGLPLPGVQVDAKTTDGVTRASVASDMTGNFRLSGLKTGSYYLQFARSGYQTSQTDVLSINPGKAAIVTVSLQQVKEATAALATIAHVQVTAAKSLQKASFVYQIVSADTLAKQGIFRASDALRNLPGVNQVNETAAPDDSVQLDIRGLGTLESETLIDGHPSTLGFGNYDWALSPIFGLQDIQVTYGSGATGLYGIDALGGTFDMKTLEPTIERHTTIRQGYGTFNNLVTAFQQTGSFHNNRVGYAIAYGIEGQDGPFRHDVFFQPAAAFDQSAPVGSPVYKLGVYQDDTSNVVRSGLAKLRYNFSDSTNLTATYLASANWHDKTGNGDNDYMPYDTALAIGKSLLASYVPPSPVPAPPFTASNPPACPSGTFLATNLNGAPNGFGPDGQPDGGVPCQTPAQYAKFNAGWYGAGPAWEADQMNDYDLRFHTTHGRNTFETTGYSDTFLVRTFRNQLPFNAVPGDRTFYYLQAETDAGFTATDEYAMPKDDFGLGYSYIHLKTDFFNEVFAGQHFGDISRQHSQDFSWFGREAHLFDPHLTAYANLWVKHSTLTNTSYSDPRLSVVYTNGNNVIRAAVGRSTTQPPVYDLDHPFSPLSLGTFNAIINCQGETPIGSAPSSVLRPERASDSELSLGHGFGGDSSIQATFYNVNAFDKLYFAALPLSVVGDSFVPPQQLQSYLNALRARCGPSAGIDQLSAFGEFNIAHYLAQGLELTGRQRITRQFFVDYMYNIQSNVPVDVPVDILKANFGLIPGSQIYSIPLHTYSLGFDYATRQGYEARLNYYHFSENNTKGLPPYGYFDLNTSIPAGNGTFNVSVTNLFNQYAFYEGKFGHAEPIGLNKYAPPSAYLPLLSQGEQFGLPFRTIFFAYTYKAK